MYLLTRNVGARTVAATDFDFDLIASANIKPDGSLTIPKPARSESGIGEGCRVLVFVERKRGQILLTHAPLAEDLLDAATKAAQAKRSS
jgi:bifunctional DNA-binding transcriptional regulator/antitoxin component of YhaV-PrlF toxin-antitoxin module